MARNVCTDSCNRSACCLDYDGNTRLNVDMMKHGSSLDGTAVDRPRGEIQIDARSHPYLADHTIEGTPVVPVALVLEWFTAAAKAWLPRG